MADLDPQTLAALGQAATALQQVLVTLSKQTGTTAADMQKFGTSSLANITTGLTGLHKEVKGGTKNFRDLGGDLRSYQQQINLLTDPIEKETAQRKLGILAQKAYHDSLKDGTKQVGAVLVKGIYDYYKTQLTTGIRGLQGDGNSIQVAADLQRAAIDSVANTAGQLGGTIGKVGQGLMMIPNPASMLAGALLTVGGGLMESGAKEAAELLKFKLEVVSKELEKSFAAFQQATAAGALFAGGMTELRKTALQAGLTQEQFSKVIADNSQSLASFGGDVTTGGKKLAKVVSNFGDGTRKELLNLGISIEDQSQGVAEYMATLQRGGSLRYKQDAEIAEGAKDYMVSLKAIAAFTGEDAKKAEQRAKEAAAQGAVDQKLREMGGDANIKFQNLVKQLGPGSEKAAQQMLLFGKIIDPKLAMVFGPKMTEQVRAGIEDVKNGAVSNNEMLENAQQFAKENSEVMLAEAGNAQKIFGTVALATGEYSEQMSLASQRATTYNKNFDKINESTITSADKAKKTQDDLTNGVIAGTEALQKMKKELQEALTPAITKFAADVPKIMEGLMDKLRKAGIIPGQAGPTNAEYAAQLVQQELAVEATVAARDAALANVSLADKLIGNFSKEQRAAIEAAAAAETARRVNPTYLPSSAEMSTGAGLGMATGGIIGARRGGVPILAAEAGLNEAFVPLPDGRSIPVKMGSDNDFKRQLLENNTVVLAAIKRIQEMYTRSIETTNMVSSKVVADSETSTALLDAIKSLVALTEDSKHELQDQSSSLKKLYDATV